MWIGRKPLGSLRSGRIGGTYPPVQVVFGPEGCGKTAWLKQSVVLLRELGFEVVYVNPINKEVFAEFSIADLRSKFLTLAEEALAQNALGRLAWLAFDIAKELISATRGGRIAVIVDDAFQILGVKESAIYVKALLNLIEYPPEHYERIITIAATSEGGLSRWEIGRHRWAWSSPMWNMPKEGFKQLYDQIPGEKPSFEEAWRITGGNPAVLARLYEVSWDVDLVVRRLMEEKKLMPEFISRWRDLLEGAVKDPDALWRSDVPEELINELIIRNLILYFMSDRDPRLCRYPPTTRERPGAGDRQVRSLAVTTTQGGRKKGFRDFEVNYIIAIM